MRNNPGSPVEKDDFFDRPCDLRKLRRELDNGAHILFTAPRRVGKTSLILRLCEQCRENDWSAAFLNVEGCSDELTFAEKLVDALQQQNLNPDALNRASTLFQKARRAIGGVKIGMGVDIEIGDAEDVDHSTLGRSLESIFRKINAEEKKVLIAIDEMPEMLLGLSRQDNGAERVARLLHWLRALRQTHRGQIHWVFLGSIGLDSFVDDRDLRKTINDLTGVTLEALNADEGDAFLDRLGGDNGLPIPPAMRRNIIERLGWALPHHLQLVFHALLDLEIAAVDAAGVDQAFRSLLAPQNLSAFDTWRQRLNEQLKAEDATAAKAMLYHLCQHPAGRSRDQILNALMVNRPNTDPSLVEQKIAGLLQLLQRDGYLLENAGAYAFRSFLLREYWYRREVL